MNTSQVVAQLMQLEAQPQTNLKSQVSSQNLIISAYQALNSRMAALQTAAEAFTAPNALTPTNPTWQAVKATSSSTSVTATATTGATVGGLAFDVTALSQSQLSTVKISSPNAVTTANALDITIGATTKHITVDPAKNTAQGVADAVNAAKIGVTAAVVTTSTGDTVLQFTGTKTGTANGFSITGLTDSTTNVRAAADAKLTVGDPAAGGYVVSSSTNTFTNLLSNVTLNVSKVETGVTVAVAADPDSIADKMQALVDSANGALAQIGQYSTYNSASKSGGPLVGDFTARQLQSSILSKASKGLDGYGSFKQFGVQLNKTGKLTFDRSAFLVAYSADPTKVQNGVANGLAKAFADVADGATDSITGSLTTAIQGANARVKDLKNRITDWDGRLAMRQQMLKRQFSAMESALGTTKNQATWLAGQIAGLPSWGGSSSSGN
nr:flagellar filament capping protein FliD [Planosporangium mesophilum]